MHLVPASLRRSLFILQFGGGARIAYELLLMHFWFHVLEYKYQQEQTLHSSPTGLCGLGEAELNSMHNKPGRRACCRIKCPDSFLSQFKGAPHAPV